MRHMTCLTFSFALLALTPLTAQAFDNSFNPWTAFRQGQESADSVARAQQEGEAQRWREQHPGSSWGAPSPSYRPPTVTNPSSPFYGLPLDQAGGLEQQRIERRLQELQQSIDRQQWRR